MHPSRWLIALALVLSFTAAAQENFRLRDGDRVVFYGDSITDQRLYTTFVETYVVTRFPSMNVRFVHSGWGGDRVNGGGGGPIDARLYRDVLPFNPTVVTIMLGMNDGRYRAFDQAFFDEFATGYKHILDLLTRQFPALRITVIQPSPYDDVTRPPAFEGGYNQVLVRYSEFLKEQAAARKLDLADLNTPIVAALKKAADTDAANAARLIPDRIHPGPAGHLLMAEALLKSWNAPATVTEVEADSRRVVHAVNTAVSDFAGGKTLSWTQTDNALPMPVDMRDPLTSLALRSSDFVDAMNRQILKVHSLAAGRYILRIDGEPVGAFTAEQFESGVNLTTIDTPMMRQAAEVHQLTLRHNNIHFTRWRQLQVPMEKDQTPHILAALSALDDVEGDLVKEQRAAARPRAHRYQIVPE